MTGQTVASFGFTKASALAAIAFASAAQASDTVSIRVSGQIEQSCTVSAPSALELGDLSIDGSAQTKFRYSCNAPFEIQLVSASGTLAAKTPPPSIGSFSSRANYSVDAAFPYDSGGQASISNCASSKLTADAEGHGGCGSANSGGKTGIAQIATLQIRWQQPSKPLLAGEYGDVLRFRISSGI